MSAHGINAAPLVKTARKAALEARADVFLGSRAFMVLFIMTVSEKKGCEE